MSETGEITGTEAIEDQTAEVETTEQEPAAHAGEEAGADETTEQSDEESEGADEESEGADEESEGADEESEQAGESTGQTLQERLENEGDIAADYLEELLDIADLDGDLDMDVEGERAIVSIVGADLSQLVGERGEVLEALQELTRLAVYRETGDRSRLMLDVSGHRAEVRRQLEELAATTATQVKETGERVALRAMTPFERKVVHDAVAAAGLTSESEGVEPRRYVVVLPA